MLSGAESARPHDSLAMPPRPADLPDYENPPLAEVALGIQLDPLPQVRAAHIGLLWERFLEEFPGLQEHPPIDMAEEDFGPTRTRTITVQLMGLQPVPRHWFISHDGSRVIQVQPDRFVLNWRRVHQDEPYPRYETLRGEFEHHYKTYLDFLTEQKLGVPTIRHAEVNYVNQIPVDSETQSIGLSDVLRTWRPAYGPEAPFLSVAEEVRIVERHLLSDQEGPYARLYVSVEPGAGSGILINLTMRGRPRGTDLRATLGFFDLARDRIVRAFTAVTTDRMHTLWRRTK
jgi:uncharacterized protein (TIGR04255 family)